MASNTTLSCLGLAEAPAGQPYDHRDPHRCPRALSALTAGSCPKPTPRLPQLSTAHTRASSQARLRRVKIEAPPCARCPRSAVFRTDPLRAAAYITASLALARRYRPICDHLLSPVSPSSPHSATARDQASIVARRRVLSAPLSLFPLPFPCAFKSL